MYTGSMSTSTRVGISITLIVLGIGYRFWRATGGGFGGPSTAEARQMAADTDMLCAELLSQANHREARQWCQEPRSAGFKMSKNEMLELAEKFYAAGADKVYVTDIEPIGNSNVSASMVVVLPSGKRARQVVFEAQAKFAHDIGEEPAKDEGQKYVLLGLD